MSDRIGKRFYYDEDVDEFVEGTEDSGNVIVITSNYIDGLSRYRVEIDDYGYMVAAVNRLIARETPGFAFPK
jgi:hypothetical protein